MVEWVSLDIHKQDIGLIVIYTVVLVQQLIRYDDGVTSEAHQMRSIYVPIWSSLGHADLEDPFLFPFHNRTLGKHSKKFSTFDMLHQCSDVIL